MKILDFDKFLRENGTNVKYVLNIFKTHHRFSKEELKIIKNSYKKGKPLKLSSISSQILNYGICWCSQREVDNISWQHLHYELEELISDNRYTHLLLRKPNFKIPSTIGDPE